MDSGTVKYFNVLQGYGAIAADSGTGDVYVHVSVLELAGLRTLLHGQRVQYKTQADRHGNAAAQFVKVV